MGSQFQISDKSCCSDWQSFPSSWRIRDCAWNWATSMHFKFTNQWHLRQIPSYNPSSATCILHMYKQLHVSYIQTTTCFICTNSYMFHMHKQLHVSYVQTATSFICTHSYTFHMYKQLHVSYVHTATRFICTNSYMFHMYKQLHVSTNQMHVTRQEVKSAVVNVAVYLMRQPVMAIW